MLLSALARAVRFPAAKQWRNLSFGQRLLTVSPSSKNRRWRHERSDHDNGGQESAASVFINSLSIGIVGVGVLLVTWPVVDHIIAPIAVRGAMIAAPNDASGLQPRKEELKRLDALLDGTKSGIWIMDGVGKTTLLRMEQGRRPCMYFNLRETGSVNDFVYQLVTHLYEPLGGFGKIVVSYTQLVQASINLLGATDGDVFQSYQELFFSLYLSHLRRAIHGSTCTGPIVPFQPSDGFSLVSRWREQGHTPLLVLDHADVALALSKASSEPGYTRMLDQLFLLAGTVSQDTCAAQVIIVCSGDGRDELEKRLAGLGCSTRRLTLGGMSKAETRELVAGLARRGGWGGSETELRRLEERAVRQGKGDPKRVRELVEREMWGKRAGRGKVCVGIEAASDHDARRTNVTAAAVGGGGDSLSWRAVQATVTAIAAASLLAVGLARGQASG